MHQLQAHILARLIRHGPQRYAGLKPEEVEGNLFSYHLRCVLKAGYVEHRPDGRYALTDKGCYYADGLSLKTMAPREQPRIFTILAVEGPGGQWLLYRRKREPLYGMIGFPAGKLHTEESLARNAERELLEKTGLENIPLAHRGDGYIRLRKGPETLSHILFHLFYGRAGSLLPLSGPAEGEPLWSDPRVIPEQEMIPSMPDLLRLLSERQDHFFAELDYSLPARPTP